MKKILLLLTLLLPIAVSAQWTNAGGIQYSVPATGDTLLRASTAPFGYLYWYAKGFNNPNFILNTTTLQPNSNYFINGTGQSNALITNGLTSQAIAVTGTGNFGVGIYSALNEAKDIGAHANGDVLYGNIFNNTFSLGTAAATVTIVGGGGSLYVPGFYPAVALKNTTVQTGISPTADITVGAGGNVTIVSIDNGGARNAFGNTLVLSNPLALGGTGGGFSCTVATTSNYTGVTYYQALVGVGGFVDAGNYHALYTQFSHVNKKYVDSVAALGGGNFLTLATPNQNVTQVPNFTNGFTAGGAITVSGNHNITTTDGTNTGYLEPGSIAVGTPSTFIQAFPGNITFQNSGFHLQLFAPTISSNRSIQIQDGNGTLAFLTDISSGYVPYTGATTNVTLGTNNIQFGNGLVYHANAQPVITFQNANQGAWEGSVCECGTDEMNVNANMKYDSTGFVGVHLAPDPTKPASWLALSTTGPALQMTPANVPQTGIGTFNNASLVGGSSYVNGNYNVSTTGGSGTGATINVTVSGNVVTSVIRGLGGQNYALNDVISATIPGGGSGFQITVNQLYNDIWAWSGFNYGFKFDLNYNMALGVQNGYASGDSKLQITRGANLASIGGGVDLVETGNKSYAVAGNIYFNPGNTGNVYASIGGGHTQIGGTTAGTFFADVQLNGNGVLSAGFIRGVNQIQTLTATANSQTLIGTDEANTFTPGAFTGITTWEHRFGNNVQINGGTLNLNNGTSNIITYGAVAISAPSSSAVSTGTKILLFPSANTNGYSLGVASGNIWFNVPAAGTYSWYVAGTSIASLSTGGIPTFTGLNTANGVVQTSPGGVLSTTTSPNIGTATATSVNKVAITAPATSATLTIANGKTLTYNNTITITGTDATTQTFPTTSATIARTDAGQTFTGIQSFLSNPVLNTTSAVGNVWIATNTTGSGNWATTPNKAHTIFTPTTGGTVALVNNQYNIINPPGALLALTVTLPSSPANNDEVRIKFTQAVTTVTYSGGTVADGITSPIAGGYVIFTYDSGTTTWY